MSEQDQDKQDARPETEPGGQPESSEGTLGVPREEYEALVQAARERDEYLDRLQRAMADYRNLQNRALRRQEEAADLGVQRLVAELLPVIDNLSRAIESSRETQDLHKLQEGLAIIDQQLHETLERFHIRPVDSIGQPFDPELHDAMAQEPSGEHPPNTVLREYQRGWLHRDRVLRPAKVIVTSRPQDEQGEEPPADSPEPQDSPSDTEP
jgi:molecular chaperone GrpE